jgi:hypothetical protein
MDGPDIRYIQVEGKEVVRRIYCAVRDENWATVPGEVTGYIVSASDAEVSVHYRSTHLQGDIDFEWDAQVVVRQDGTLRFAMDGTARRPFVKNRIGFCVLHPANFAGSVVKVFGGGSGRDVVFPEGLVTEQPVSGFSFIRKMEHREGFLRPVTLTFEGDDFEMEDQRCWTDASYKTFCTPLSLPRPVRIEAGTRVAQAVEVTASAAVPAPVRQSKQVISAEDAVFVPLPQLGTVWKGDPGVRLPVDFVRVESGLAPTDYPLEAVLWDGSGNVPTGTVRVIALPRTESVGQLIDLEQLIPVTRAVKRFVGSSSDYFLLKRCPWPAKEGIGIAFAMNPQVHAFDDRSVFEALEAQVTVIRDAIAFCGGEAAAVGPITLTPRFNPYAAPGASPKPMAADPRLHTAFGTAWTLGSILYSASAGASSLCYYESVDLVSDGLLRPLGELFGIVHPFSGGELALLNGSQPTAVFAGILSKGSRRTLVVANGAPEPAEVDIIGLAVPLPLRLQPYEVMSRELSDHDGKAVGV